MPGDNSKTQLADALNALLADSFALYLKTKNFHWHVTGPNFRDYHLMLDEQATAILAITDIIAERVRKNGQRTLTSIGSIAAKQSITDNDTVGVSAEAMLEELRKDNLTLVDAFRAIKPLAADANDNSTEGLMDDWTDQAEERAWFLGATLQKA